jgi:hypothetical protein
MATGLFPLGRTTGTLSLFFLVLNACCCQPGVNIRPVPQPAVTPQYQDLVEIYNRNLLHLQRISASATVTFDWTEEGKHRNHQGDGRFVAILPDRLALKLGKLIANGLWIGCNAEQYWFFDLMGDKTAYVGRQASVGRPGTQPLPAPIYPLDIPRIMGLLPIDVRGPSPAPPAVDWSGQPPKGAWIIEPPGTRSRLFLDPDTNLPVRIELLDAQRQITVAARLSDPVSVETAGVAPGLQPRIAGRIDATVVQDHSRMVLYLAAVSDGGDPPTFREDIIFDFARLCQSQKPAKVVDLDQPER